MSIASHSALAMAGTSTTSGEPERLTASLGVLTVRAGRITHWPDFPNVVGAAETTGALPTLAAILTGPSVGSGPEPPAG